MEKVNTQPCSFNTTVGAPLHKASGLDPLGSVGNPSRACGRLALQSNIRLQEAQRIAQKLDGFKPSSF
jgi:hypothetical protein